MAEKKEKKEIKNERFPEINVENLDQIAEDINKNRDTYTFISDESAEADSMDQNDCLRSRDHEKVFNTSQYPNDPYNRRYRKINSMRGYKSIKKNSSSKNQRS
jgi:hypothetical protein